ASGRVDRLENDRRRRKTQAGAAVALGNERREPTVIGQRLHELGRIAVGLEAAPVLAVEARAQVADRGTDLMVLGRGDHAAVTCVRSTARRRIASPTSSRSSRASNASSNPATASGSSASPAFARNFSSTSSSLNGFSGAPR